MVHGGFFLPWAIFCVRRHAVTLITAAPVLSQIAGSLARHLRAVLDGQTGNVARNEVSMEPLKLLGSSTQDHSAVRKHPMMTPSLEYETLYESCVPD